MDEFLQTCFGQYEINFDSQIGRLRLPFARPSGRTKSYFQIKPYVNFRTYVHLIKCNKWVRNDIHVGTYVRNDIFARNDIMFGMTLCSE